MKKLGTVSLFLCLLLCGCGRTAEVSPTDSTETPESSTVIETAEDTTESLKMAETVITESDTAEASSWKTAYFHTVEDFELWLKEEAGMEESDAAYSLIYIDNDDTPELLIDSYAMQELYTFSHGSAVCVNNSSSYRYNHFSGYEEKTGRYWIYDSAGSDNWYLTVIELKNGNTEHVETLGCNSALQGDYYLEDQALSKEEAEQRLSEYRAMEAEYEMFTFAEMLEILAE